MRLTNVLFRQRLNRMAKQVWDSKRERKILDDGTINALNKRGIEVKDALELFPKRKHPKAPYVNIVGVFDKPPKLDNTHPDWKETPCYVLKPETFLLNGLQQAQVLTKTIHIAQTLPENINEFANNDSPPHVHDQVKKATMMANIYDTEQQKLPKIKDPTRPMYNFPRIYGITDVRKTFITVNKMLNILEKNCGELSKQTLANDDVEFTSHFIKDSDLLLFKAKSDMFISSRAPLPPVSDAAFTTELELPDLHPIRHTITIDKKNFYDLVNNYSISDVSLNFHPHTTFLRMCRTQFSNIYETPITDNQIEGRCMMHTFTVASSYAKKIYGDDVKELPKPVTIQCVNTDGCYFDFATFQLNTLDLDKKDGIKNIWYSLQKVPLFRICEYFEGRPVLQGYNPKVFNYLNAFYNNR